MAIGYRRPDQFHRDDLPLTVVEMILGGSGGWLNRELVEEKQVALAVRAQSSFPGGFYPHLFAFLILPAPGRSAEDVEAALTAVLTRLQSAPVDPTTLARAKAQARREALESLNDNAGAAAELAAVASAYGDWRRLFAELDGLNTVSAADVQRVAVKYFVPDSRTTVYSRTAPPAQADPVSGGRP
jgi:predicted Zn-dependent peptidase